MESIFTAIRTQTKKNLTHSEIKELMSITYPNENIPIINENNKDIVYQIMSSIEKYGVASTLDLMRGHSILTPAQLDKGEIKKDQINESIIFGNEAFIGTYTAYRTNSQILREPELVGTGAEDCPKCKSNNTTSQQRQTRSADEASITFNQCKACKYRWRV